MGHKHVEIFQTFESQTKILQNELQELEKSIYPKYKEIATNIPVQKAGLSKNYQKLTTAINKQGEVWHREIDTIVRNLISDVNKMECEHMTVLDQHEVNITQNISKITKTIEDLKEKLESDDILLISEYKSKNAEFRRLATKVKVSLPNFMPKHIIRNWLIQQFGSLSALSFTTEEQEYGMPSQKAELSPPVWSLMDVPHVVTAIDTGYKCLNSVDCLNDKEIWTCGDGKILKLYNLQKEILKSVETNFENQTRDIAVTRNENLVFTEYNDRTVNVMYKNGQMQAVIKILGWIPRSLCCTLSNDLLVVMKSDDYKQIKVVRYTGATEKQRYQFDDKKRPLYSSGSVKYICENRNRDICVSDCRAHGVVVVNQTGKLRFTYTGPPNTKESFGPVGITTDSLSRILTADWNNHRIHIVDQDGQFLQYINNCDLLSPWGLCVDSRDNLFVAEWGTGIVKKVKYCI